MEETPKTVDDLIKKEEGLPYNQKPGFFSKIKQAFTSTDDEKKAKRDSEMLKLYQQEEKIKEDLKFQKKKSDVAKQRQEVANLAKKRRAGSTMGQVFSKIGNAVTAPRKTGSPKLKFRDPFASFQGQSGFGGAQDNFGTNVGVSNRQTGRVEPQVTKKKIVYEKRVVRGKTVFVPKQQVTKVKPPVEKPKPLSSPNYGFSTGPLSEFERKPNEKRKQLW